LFERNCLHLTFVINLKPSVIEWWMKRPNPIPDKEDPSQ
jgi:hypothetical protein